MSTNDTPNNANSRGSKVQPLPLGAMPAAPSPKYTAAPNHSPQANGRESSPPASPTDPLMDGGVPHVQYASYPQDRRVSDPEWKGSTIPTAKSEATVWIPTPLKTWFWLLLVSFMIVAAIGLEVALSISKKRNGWPTKSSNTATDALHYAYTIPPIAVAMVIVALWAWTDIEIKKMQPYVSLVHGNADPNKSLLLDYTRVNNFFVWASAMKNRHWLVALATLMLIMSMSFQPLAGALVIVRDVWLTQVGPTMKSLASLGLNQNTQFQDLTYFLGAVSYASSSILFNLGNAPFVFGQYAVAPFQLPTSIFGNNGTVHANTTAVKTNPGCQPVSVTNVATADDGWDNSASLNGCSAAWHVNHSSPTLFGTNTLNCTNQNSVPTQFSPVVFWFFTYEPAVATSATFCFPTLSFFDVNVGVDISSGNITSLTEIGPFSTSSNFSSFSANVTGDPLDSRAYNGIAFNLTQDFANNPFIQQRQQAIRLQMPAAVMQNAIQSPGGMNAAFSTNSFAGLSNQIYQIYLNLVASKVYYLPVQEDIYQEVSTFQKRLLLADVAVHLLVVAMLLLSLFGSIIHILHRHDRRMLRLRHEPGTIASAVSIGAQTEVGALIDGRQEEQEMYKALGNRKFRIDPDTMKIVMQGEDGYEYAASPGLQKRRSVFRSIMDGRQRASLWLGNSVAPSGLPKSPLPTPGSARSNR